MLKESLGQLISASCHLKKKSSFCTQEHFKFLKLSANSWQYKNEQSQQWAIKINLSLRTHPSIFTSAAPKLFERYNLTKWVLWHIMDISPSQCLGKFKSLKTSRKNLSEVEQIAQVQNYPLNKYYHATAVLKLRSLCN